MSNGLLGALANPEFADIGAAFQRQDVRRGERQQAQKKADQLQALNNIYAERFTGKLAKGLRSGTVNHEAAVAASKAFGIPVDQKGRLAHWFGTAKVLDKVMGQVGPEAALDILNTERAFFKDISPTPRMDEFALKIQQDPATAAGDLAAVVKAGELAGFYGEVEKVSDKERAETEKIGAEASLKTPEQQLEFDKLKLEIQNKQADLDKKKAEIIKVAEEKDEQAITQAFDAKSGLDMTRALLKGGAFKDIYGFGGAIPFTIFPSSFDTEARRDNLLALLTLEARKKLVGQGTITDFESKLLEKGASILKNPRIGDDVAQVEIERIEGIFEGAHKRSLQNRAVRNALGIFAFDVPKGAIEIADGMFQLLNGDIVRPKRAKP